MKAEPLNVHYADIAPKIRENWEATPEIPLYEDRNSIQGKTVTRFVEGLIKRHFPKALDSSVVYLAGTPGTHGGMDPQMQVMLHVPLDAAPDAITLEAFKKDLEPLKNSHKGMKYGNEPWGQVTPQPVWGSDKKIDDAARVFISMDLSLADLYRNLHESQKGQGPAKST